MTYVSAEARQELLDTIGDAIDELGVALADLGEAYELLDERTADRLEEDLFRPIPRAYGRAKRTHGDFAGRYDLEGRAFEPKTPPGAPSRGVKAFVDIALDAVAEAEATLSELQDSMMPVEVGDAELRAGLADVRALIADVPERAHRFVSVLGR